MGINIPPSSAAVFPTGIILQTFKATADTGFVLLAGGTIGSATSGATVLAASTAQNLYTHLWNSLANTEAPVTGGRGASAAIDWAANKPLTLPNYAGKTPLGKTPSGTGSTMGGTFGALDHSHSVPAHYHSVGAGTGSTLNITASGGDNTGSNSVDHTHTFSVTSAGDGGHAHQCVYQVGTNSGTGNNAGTFPLFGPASNGTHNSPFSTLPAGAISGGNHTHGVSGTTVGQSVGHTHTIPTHIHAAGDFAGSVGWVTGGVSGNSAINTDTKNHPCFVCNFQISL